MKVFKTINNIANAIETFIISFFVRRAGKWAAILNKQVIEEVDRQHLEMIESHEKSGIDWDFNKMSPLIDKMKEFRTESIKFAFGHVISVVAIIFSMIAIVISLIK